MAYRQIILLSKPFMTEDAVLLCVWYMTLRKKQRFLFTREMYSDITLDRKRLT